MTTITINECTKAGKTLLELANLLAISNKGVTIDKNVKKSTNNGLSPKQKKLLSTLKRVKKNAQSGNYKTQSVKSFLNEL